MKKISKIFVLLSMFLMVTPFALQAQNKAKVTVTIKKLIAISSDACGYMDFFAKIHMGRQVKSFPVREGNYLPNLNWQFTADTPADEISFMIEIWDDDVFGCGEGDDRVNVNGRLNKIRKTFSTLVPYSHDITSTGVPGDGNEVAEIVFNVTIEPITPPPSKIALLTERNWIKKSVFEISDGNGIYRYPYLIETATNCQKDNYYKFYSNGTYRLDEGSAKCTPTDPQIIEVGKWSFIENETQLQIIKEGALKPQVFSIFILTASSLKLAEHFDERFSRNNINRIETNFIH